MDKKWRLILSIITVLVLGIGTAIGVFLVQGNTLDPKTGKIVQTGVLIVNSVPNGAAIYIDDHYQNATNTSISFLPAKTYKVTLKKEGYINWEKEMTIDKEVISEIEAILWPAIPAANPITNTGAVNVKISHDNLKIAYGIKYSEKDKAGLWVMDMAKRTVFSGPSTDFAQIARNTPNLDFSSASYIWSPDSKQILATLQENSNPDPRFERNFILDTTRLNTNPVDVTLTKETVLKTWYEELKANQSIRLAKLVSDPEGQKIASNSATPIKWSYDGNMFLYTTGSPVDETSTATPTSSPTTRRVRLNNTKTASESSTAQTSVDASIASYSAQYKYEMESQTATYAAELNVKVYDIKKKKSFDMPKAEYYTWYPAEEKADREIQHLIMIDDGSMSIIETDGKNKSTVYSGPFLYNQVFAWPDGGRLVMLANFNTKAGSEPNLYTINLR